MLAWRSSRSRRTKDAKEKRRPSIGAANEDPGEHLAVWALLTRGGRGARGRQEGRELPGVRGARTSTRGVRRSVERSQGFGASASRGTERLVVSFPALLH